MSCGNTHQDARVHKLCDGHAATLTTTRKVSRASPHQAAELVLSAYAPPRRRHGPCTHSLLRPAAATVGVQQGWQRAPPFASRSRASRPPRGPRGPVLAPGAAIRELIEVLQQYYYCLYSEDLSRRARRIGTHGLSMARNIIQYTKL